MLRTIRFAMIALLIGAGLLLPVLLRGQGSSPTQPWGPGTAPVPALGKPRPIASTSSTKPEESPRGVSAMVPLPDDGLRASVPRVLPPAVEMATPLRMAPMPALLPEPATTRVSHQPTQPSVSVSVAEAREPALAATPGVSTESAPRATATMQSAFTSVLSVEVLGPAQVVQDDLMPLELVVRNTGTQVLTEVRIELPLPAGIRYVAGQPSPEVNPERLAWDLGVLEVRGERRLRVDLMVRTADEVALRARAFYNTGAPYRPRVVRPTFAVTQNNAEVVPRGMTTVVQIQVTNHGNKPLHRVMLTDRLPAGLSHPQGAEVCSEIGTLQPGESRLVKLDVIAHRSGRWVNEVQAEAVGGERSISRAAIVVAEPSLTVRLHGPASVSVAGEADYRLEVINGPQGPAANGLKLMQALPEGLELIQATTNGQFDPLNRRVVWQLGTLEPGQMQTVFVKVRCLVPGQWLSRATLTADQMAATTSEHTLAGEGGCLLNLTVQGREEHLEVNGETVYEARVVNPGTKPARNMRLSAWIPEGMAPLKADGPEGVGVRIQQQQVVFESVKQLDPKAAVVFRVRVRGQRPGVWRLRVEVLADQMARPIIDELPVSVQPDSRTRAMGNLENR